MSFKTAQGEQAFKAEYEKNLKLWPVAFDTFYIHTSYGDTHIVAAGAKELPPLILLHGAGLSSTGWYKNIESLTENFRVYALDVLGDMNLSDPIKSFLKGEDIADWVCEVLDALGIDKTSVVAHSAGGFCSLNFVIHAQHRVDRLVLLAPAASFAPFRRQFFARLLLINLIRKEPFIRLFFWKWFIAGENSWVLDEFSCSQFFAGVLHYKWKVKPVIPAVIDPEQLRMIHVPTLLLIGDQEVIYDPNKAMQRAAELIPSLEAKMIPNANHLLFIEQAEAVNTEMVQFLLR